MSNTHRITFLAPFTPYFEILYIFEKIIHMKLMNFHIAVVHHDTTNFSWIRISQALELRIRSKESHDKASQLIINFKRPILCQAPDIGFLHTQM
jgi:hypothetical protein